MVKSDVKECALILRLDERGDRERCREIVKKSKT